MDTDTIIPTATIQASPEVLDFISTLENAIASGDNFPNIKTVPLEEIFGKDSETLVSAKRAFKDVVILKDNLENKNIRSTIVLLLTGLDSNQMDNPRIIKLRFSDLNKVVSFLTAERIKNIMVGYYKGTAIRIPPGSLGLAKLTCDKSLTTFIYTTSDLLQSLGKTINSANRTFLTLKGEARGFDKIIFFKDVEDLKLKLTNVLSQIN
jgi:hypothetical protein